MTLTEVARLYRDEGERITSHRRIDARNTALGMANWLDRCVANRTPNDLHVTHATQVSLTSEWVREHGYQIAATGAGTGAISLLLQRGDELLIANLPAHLHWDGQRIVLDDQEQP